MKVYPKIIHKWVDTNGQIVLAPGLMNVRLLFILDVVNLIQLFIFSLLSIPI